MLVTRTMGPRTLASVFAVICHFPSKDSRRLSSGEGKGVPNGLIASSVIFKLLIRPQGMERGAHYVFGPPANWPISCDNSSLRGPKKLCRGRKVMVVSR